MSSYGSSQVANKATLNLILGVFLKLLGFFVVLYTYTDINPIKAHQVEESLRERFNISVSLINDRGAADTSLETLNQGRSFTRIKDSLSTEVDFLSSKLLSTSNTMVLTVPAEFIVSINDALPKSPEFAKALSKTLLAERNNKSVYALELIINGSDQQLLSRQISLFVQKMIAVGYPSELLTIGYNETTDEPTVDLRIVQVGDAS